MKRYMLPIDKMLEIEDWIEKSALNISNNSLTDQSLLEKLNLKLEYVSENEFPPYTEAELAPCEDDNYNGVIRINQKYMNNKFSYVHEVIHYLMDVGLGNKVTHVFARKTKGRTIDEHEQVVNYATASAIMRYDKIKGRISDYDKSSPKMDELKFVDDICNMYGQEKRAVIRRIQEVRQIMKKRMQNY